MGVEEQDQELGRLVRERSDKERELACLANRRDRFEFQIKENLRKLLYPLQKLSNFGNTLSDGKTEIEWMDADAIVRMVSDIGRLTREVDVMKNKLKQMGVG